MASYDTFKLWYAKSIASNSFASADDGFKLQNTTTTDKARSLIYCNPLMFAKRQTDTSNALAVDPTSPDTGTGMSDVILKFTEGRTAALGTSTALKILINFFYNKSSDPIFKKGRFGLENTDNPDLDVLPLATAGYKFINFRQEPNPSAAGLLTYLVQLKFLGDHTKLGTRT